MTAEGTVSSGSGSYSPPIPQSDVTGLVSALASLVASVAAAAVDAQVIHKTGAESAAGLKTFADGAEFGDSGARIVIDDLGDTQGVWIDATLSSGSNPTVSVKLRGKGPGGAVETYSVLNATAGLAVTGTATVGGSTIATATDLAAKADASATSIALAGKASSVHTHAESDVTSLATDLAAKVPATRSVAAGTGLTGGGDLSADRTLAVAYGTTSGTATQGNDARVTGAVQNTRQVLAGTGATGGGALSADVTVGVAYDTAKPYGAISLGTVGVANKAARSDHRHPGNGWAAVDHGLIGWNFPNFIGGASQILSAAGTLTVWKVPVDEAALAAAGGVITNVVLAVGSIGVTLTSGQNFAGLWLADGTQVGITADQAASWVSAGVKVMPLAGGPYAPTGGAQEVYVGAWYNGTTSPGFVRAGSAPSGLANVGLASSATYKYATANTGLTTAGANLGTRTASNNMIWAAVS